jgi:hypothetical protein
VDQDNRQVHFNAAKGQADGGNHQRPQRNAAPGCAESPAFQGHLFSC